MKNTDLVILTVCQLISATGSIVVVTLGGIIGAALTRNPALATLPVSMMVISVAITTVPATVLMRCVGRSRGFALASLSAVVAVLVAVMALSAQSFALFIVATMLFGINFAFTHQYRYAAAESVPPRYTARAVSFVLLGAIGGALIERAGVTRMMMLGALSLLLTSVVGLQGQSVLHYWWALVLLGVGWNFMYVGATTMLTYTYSMSERFRAQAINEFLVFGTAAAASLLAGTIVHYFGWLRLMLVPLPLLLVVCAALLLVRRDPLLRTVESV